MSHTWSDWLVLAQPVRPTKGTTGTKGQRPFTRELTPPLSPALACLFLRVSA